MPLCKFDLSVIAESACARLIGIDEAGRGPLAGPVTACAAWVPPAAYPAVSPFINDSKKLSEAKREAAFSAMLRAGVRFGFGCALPAEIDRVNILEATFNAMGAAARRLLSALGEPGGGALLLVDGPLLIRRLGGLNQRAVVDGDAKSLSIAAASIFAKVTRDRWMAALDRRYPGYGLAGHKGYGTAAHLAALSRLGPCPEHRRSFGPVAKAAAASA